MLHFHRGTSSPGTVTTTGSPTSGKLTKFSGTTSITNGDLSGAVTTAGTLAATLTTSFLPQGRLTTVTGTPVLTADSTAQSTVYYTPYVGNNVPIYDGTNTVMTAFTELSLALDTSNHLNGPLYDVFVWSNAGTVSIGTGPGWTKAATVTMTIATPCVVTWTGHGLIEGRAVVFTNSGGALPTGITAGTVYYVARSPAANTFNVSTTPANGAAGTLIATSGSQSGTHTGTVTADTRGTGAGTTELQLKNGIWTNANSITLKNGAGAGTAGIGANQATYVGTLFMTANGQTGMAFKPVAAAGGGFNFLAVYNAYNRVRVNAVSRDSTASWTPTTTTWRPINQGGTGGGVQNRVVFVDGLRQSPIKATYEVLWGGGTSLSGYLGVNLDNTDQPPTTSAQAATPTNATAHWMVAHDAFAPQLGLHYVQPVEAVSGSSSFFGAQTTPTRQLNALIVELEM